MIIGYTPPKINIEPQNPPIEKESHLPNPHFFQDISCLKNEMPPSNGDKKVEIQIMVDTNIPDSTLAGINKITFDKNYSQRKSRHFLAGQREGSPRWKLRSLRLECLKKMMFFFFGERDADVEK